MASCDNGLLTSDAQLKLNTLTRKLGIRFYATQTQGLNGWFFSDLGAEHTYLVEIPAGEGVRTKVQYQQAFVPLETALATTWVSLKPRQVQRLKFKPGLFATLGKFTLVPSIPLPFDHFQTLPVMAV